jgi:hypothetical protein
MTPLHAVLAVVVLSSAPAATESQPDRQGATAPRDFDSPPPGTSPADQALWRRARFVNNQILIERGIATRLQARARGNAYVEQLTSLGNEGALPAKTAEDLSWRIYARWGEIAKLLSRQWPVDPTRSCRAPLLVFEGVLLREESPGKKAQLDDVRRILQGCVDRGSVPLEALAKLNVQFEAVLAEAERSISEARKGTPPAASAPEVAVTPAAASGQR